MRKFETTYSQAGQDLAAAEVCDKTEGFYLDLGCNDPIFHNNTYLLEKELGWTGILVDIQKPMVDKCRNVRTDHNSYVSCDLITTNITEVLDSLKCPKHIDYISFDVDDATSHVLGDFDFDKYSFSFITFEHDLYRIGPELKQLANKLFISKGYTMYRENVCASPVEIFEDWYIKE